MKWYHFWWGMAAIVLMSMANMCGYIEGTADTVDTCTRVMRGDG